MSEVTSATTQLEPEYGQYGILMSDLRGFTAISEQYDILDILPLLNYYFEEMTLIIDRHGGFVDKFMGDSVLALFNLDEEDAYYRILSCAIDMQLAMDRVNQFGDSRGLPAIYMGIGISAGNIVICELGSAIYREKTVLGDPVNVAARMATFALRGQVLITETVFAECGKQVELGAGFNLLLKGKKQILRIHELQGLLYPDRKTIPLRENRRSPRVEAYLPVTYYCIEKKHVQPTAIKADIRDISYGGMNLLTHREHSLLDELKIIVPFAVGKESSSEVYAKVLTSTREENNMYSVSVEFTYLDEFARKSIKSLVDHLV